MNRQTDICPVCKMKADPDLDSEEYYKMYFHFCSEQCRKTFLAHPNLYLVKPGQEQKEILKRRTIVLAKPLGKAGTELLSAYLLKLMGVKEVLIEGDKINLSYDLLQVTEMQIEKVLEEVGVALGGNWLERLRRDWIRSGEVSELDNLAAPPARSYNHIPPKV